MRNINESGYHPTYQRAIIALGNFKSLCEDYYESTDISATESEIMEELLMELESVSTKFWSMAQYQDQDYYNEPEEGEEIGNPGYDTRDQEYPNSSGEGVIESFESFFKRSVNEAKEPKIFTIEREGKTGSKTKQKGTLEELIKKNSYTLETGKSYEKEKGNKKIDLNPKSIKSLIKNLENSADNAAKDGYSGVTYREITDSGDK